ncbi:uncharacterized protein LOC135398768 [Ornithodoros turicata]|uniref:uncharacterized protein LOC135398768 n=1 Tax=Ornithodoros turicata TaxID=34597 RepID=UPI003138B648
MVRVVFLVALLLPLVTLFPQADASSGADLLRYMSCFQKLGEVRGACGKKHQDYKDHSRFFFNDPHNKKEKKSMCCKYSSYVNCYVKNARHYCGDGASKVVSKFIEKNAQKAVRDTCKKFDGSKCAACFGSTASALVVITLAAISSLFH